MGHEKRVLVVVAHPDDEILGCGGFLAKCSRENNFHLHVSFLSHGIGSRGNWSLQNKIVKEKQAVDALEMVGVKQVHWAAALLKDNCFDEINLLQIIKQVENAIRLIEPHIILTHYRDDLNIDHRITYQAVLTATRPYSFKVEEIYSFEVPSSTEWNYPTKFSPNVFYSLEKGDVIKKEIAFAKYKDEVREYPHPRSMNGIWTNAEYWGMKSGAKYAEAFELVRIIR